MDASQITKLTEVIEGTPELVVVVLLTDTKHTLVFFLPVHRLAFSFSNVYELLTLRWEGGSLVYDYLD